MERIGETDQAKAQRDREKWSAYGATTFKVEPPGPDVSIRVGRVHPELDAAIKDRLTAEHPGTAADGLRRGEGSWAFITAYNPGGRPRSREENERAHEGLWESIKPKGKSIAWPGSGMPDDPDWEPEHSILVVGVSRKEAIELGAQYGQAAIVYGVPRGKAELVACEVARPPEGGRRKGGDALELSEDGENPVLTPETKNPQPGVYRYVGPIMILPIGGRARSRRYERMSAEDKAEVDARVARNRERMRAMPEAEKEVIRARYREDGVEIPEFLA